MDLTAKCYLVSPLQKLGTSGFWSFPHPFAQGMEEKEACKLDCMIIYGNTKLVLPNSKLLPNPSLFGQSTAMLYPRLLPA